MYCARWFAVIAANSSLHFFITPPLPFTLHSGRSNGRATSRFGWKMRVELQKYYDFIDTIGKLPKNAEMNQPSGDGFSRVRQFGACRGGAETPRSWFPAGSWD